MRIAIVGTELCAVDSRGGGLEHVLLRWAAALSPRHDVVIVSHRHGRPPFETALVNETAELDTVLRRVRPDVVSLHNRPGWVRHCPPRASVAVTFHNFPAAWKYRGRSLPNGARYSAVSGALSRVVPSDRPVTVTYPSIAPEFCQPAAWTPGSTGVLFPHRLMRKKGLVELLAIACRPEFASVEFAFADLLSPWVRPTAEHRSLRAAIAPVPNASLFPPARSASELARLYGTAGVVACPAIEPEGLGLVPLEAQACGAPVVSTDLGGLTEATFAPNECVSLEHFASALERALARRSMSATAREAVLSRFAPDVSGAAYERWLTEGA